MKSIAALALAICSPAVFANSADTPVNQAEAAAVFAKLEHVVKGVLQVKTPIPSFPSGSAVASREQILKQFTALYAAVQPKFKFTPPPQKSAPGVLSFKDAQSKQDALRLETMGFVDRYGPLATSKAEGLSPDEFGDAIGYLIARVAELTHTPTSKFSPYLMPP